MAIRAPDGANKEEHNSLLVFPPECVSCVPCKGNQYMLISLVFYFIAGNPKFVAGAHQTVL